MKVIKNYLYNASYQVFVLLVPLITTPYLARVLGPKGVGINSFTNSVIQYFILFGGIGIGLYGNRQIAFVRDSKEKMSQTFYEIFFMRMVTISISCVAFIIFIVISDQYRNYYLAQSISLIAAAFDISWFFMGIENFAVTVLRNFIVKIVTLISIFLFVKSYENLNLYIMILSLSLLFGNLTLFPSLHRYIKSPKWKDLNIWRHLKPSMLLFVPQIATQLYLVLNKTMLGVMNSVQATGYFDQSDKMIKLILAIVTASGTVMLPRVAHTFANGEHNKSKEYLYGSFSFVTTIAIPMMFGLVAVAPKFVPLFFTNKFINVVPIMIIESIVILLIAWSNVVGMQYLLPTNQARAYTISVILGAIINLIANIPLILIYGAVGAAISTVLSESTVTIYQLFAIRNQISYSRLFKDTIKCFCAGILMFLIISCLDVVLTNSWSNLILEILLGIVLYVLFLFILRVQIIYQVKRILKK